MVALLIFVDYQILIIAFTMDQKQKKKKQVVDYLLDEVMVAAILLPLLHTIFI